MELQELASEAQALGIHDPTPLDSFAAQTPTLTTTSLTGMTSGSVVVSYETGGSSYLDTPKPTSVYNGTSSTYLSVGSSTNVGTGEGFIGGMYVVCLLVICTSIMLL